MIASFALVQIRTCRSVPRITAVTRAFIASDNVRTVAFNTRVFLTLVYINALREAVQIKAIKTLAIDGCEWHTLLVFTWMAVRLGAATRKAGCSASEKILSAGALVTALAVWTIRINITVVYFLGTFVNVQTCLILITFEAVLAMTIKLRRDTFFVQRAFIVCATALFTRFAVTEVARITRASVTAF